MTSLIARLRLTLLAPLLAGCTIAHLGPIEVEPTGGAGFAGLRTYELLQQPAFSVPASCTAGRCAPVPVLDSVDLIPNHHYAWRPALSTGVTFQHYAKTGSHLGGGLGANIVLLPDATGTAAPWPAITAHIGTHTNGFFFGLILSPTDAVVLPGGAASIRVQRDRIPELVLKNRGHAGHLYLGIRIGGRNQAVAIPDTAR